MNYHFEPTRADKIAKFAAYALMCLAWFTAGFITCMGILW